MREEKAGEVHLYSAAAPLFSLNTCTALENNALHWYLVFGVFEMVYIVFGVIPWS